MSAETTTATAAEFQITEIVSRIVSDVGYEQSVMRPLVRVADISDAPTDRIDFPKWNDLSGGVSAPGEASDLTNTAINPTEVSVTAVEVGIMATITDMLLVSNTFRNIGPYAQQMGVALNQKVDTDILAEVADFGTSVGASGVDLTEANILSAIYELDNGAVMQDTPLVGVLHSIQLADLRTDLANSTGVVHGRGEVSGFDGRRMTYLGIPLLRSNLCASVGGNADRQGVIMPIGDQCGLAYVEKWAARTELERDASLRATEVVVTAAYGDECVNTDAYAGVAVITDHE